MAESKSIFFLAGDRFTCIPSSLMIDKDSKGNDLLVYLAVNFYADRTTGVAFINQQKIIDRSKKSEPTVTKAISHLCEIGWATKIRRGQGKVNITILHAFKKQKFTDRQIREIRKDVENKINNF